MTARLFTRRRLLRTLGCGALAVPVVGAYTGKIAPHWLEVVERDLAIRHLPEPLSGKKLVQISDVHIGPQVDDDYLLTCFRRVSEMAPEIVVYTGDFISHYPGYEAHIQRMFPHLPHGTLGTCGILGNHDYGKNWLEEAVASCVVRAAAQSGIMVLRNAIHEVAGLQIVGMDDLWAGQFIPAEAFGKLDRKRAALVLSHNPDTADLDGWNDYEGWILAGHTHGGQCKPPFLPPPLLPVRNRGYVAGEYPLAGSRSLYINRGVGHLLQVRFNVRPEITVFRMTKA